MLCRKIPIQGLCDYQIHFSIIKKRLPKSESLQLSYFCFPIIYEQFRQHVPMIVCVLWKVVFIFSRCKYKLNDQLMSIDN